jgi:hypothetical protein
MNYWYWYAARNDELFIDMDRYTKSIDHVRRRLQGAIECHTLNVRGVYLYPSITKDHAHLIITLWNQLPDVERFAWEMLFHGDIYRAASNMMRWSHLVPYPDILIARSQLHRYPDGMCTCESKHKRAMMLTCDTAQRLRGKDRAAQYFGKPSDTPCQFTDILASYDVTQFNDLPLP